MLSPSTSATLLNRLFTQLIEPILLYAVEQWIPYIHPRKVDKLGPTTTFASITSQLNMEDVWKRMVYAHYQRNVTTPTIAVRSELGSTPTYIPRIARLAKYLSYITGPGAPPLVARAVMVQKAISSSSKFGWWNNSWRLLKIFISLRTTSALSTLQNSRMISKANIADGGFNSSWTPMLYQNSELSGSSKNHLPHLNTLTKGLASFDQLLSDFTVRITDWISNWADTLVSLDLTANVASARLMQSVMNFMHSNAQPFSIYKSSVTSMLSSKPQFITMMTEFKPSTQRYITLLMSRIKLC